MDVNTYKPTNSNAATISEFLRIIPCLFMPFNIPNIVVDVKNTGAVNPAYKIYLPRSSL